MANIRGITIEIGGNTTKLTEALKNVNKEIQGTQKDLKELDKLLKLDPGNTDLLAQKQKALTDAISATKKKLDEEKTALEQLKNAPQTEQTVKQQEALTREIAKTEQSLKSLQDEYKNFGSVAAQQLKATGEKMQEVGGKISNAGKALAPVSAVITGLGATAVKITADFDEQMSKVKAISGATGDEFDALRDKAREMGAKTKFSATEAAQAFEYMAMAGWKTNDMLDGIEGIMNLAAASGVELASTSDIVTDALTAFGLKASDSGHFADVLAAASTNANTNVSLLGESFKYAGTTAGAFGFSAEDTVLALGLMANAGIKGSHAGESLKNALVNLEKPTKKQSEAMMQLGFITTETVQKIDFSKVEKAQRKVEEATLNLSTAQAKYNAAVSKYSANSPQVIAAHNNLEKTTLRLKSAQAELEKQQQGVSKEVMGQNTLMTNSDGTIKSLNEIMLTLRSTLGRVNVELTDSEGNVRDFDDVIKQLATSEDTLTQAQQLQYAATLFGKQNMSGMLAILTASDEDYQKLAQSINNCDDRARTMSETMQDNLNGQLTKLMSALQELAIQIGDALMPIVRKVVEKIQSWVEWLQQMDDGTRDTILVIGAFVAALAPVLIIIGQLVISVGAITSAIGTFTAFMSATAIPAIVAFFTAFGPVIAVIAAVVAAITGLIIVIKNWGAICEWFGKLWDSMCEGIKNVWNGTCKYLSDIFTSIAALVSKVFTGIKDFFSDIWESISGICSSAWDGICNIVSVGIKLIESIISGALKIITLPFSLIWENCKDAVTAAWDKITDGISSTLNLIGGLIGKTWTGIKDKLVPVLTNISNAVKDKWNDAKNAVSNALEKTREAVNQKWGAIKDYVSSTVENVTNTVGEKWNAAKERVSSTVEAMKTAVGEKWDAIKERLMPVLQNIGESITSRWDAIKESTANIFDTVAQSVSTAWDNIKMAVTSKASAMWDSIKNIFTGIWDTIKNIVQRIRDCFSFEWKLPKIKLPHFKIKGEFSLSPPSVPYLSIEWYKKAMDDAYILNDPTIFGMSGNRLLGGGEAGQEAVVGTGKLGEIVRDAVASVIGGGSTVIPVYIGQERIEEIVVRANRAVNYRSGGR